MKKSRCDILKALSMMDEQRVSKFLDNDCRSIDEIVDSVVDERETEYIYFMVDLLKMVDEIEKSKNIKNKELILGNVKLINSNKVPLITDEQFNKIKETVKYTPTYNFMPNLNLPDVTLIKRGN